MSQSPPSHTPAARRRRRELKKARGLCIECPSPAEAHRTRCRPCLDRRKAYTARARQDGPDYLKG